MGRALGETIAVAMVIGNNYALPHSLLAPGATLGSAIINNFGEATSRASTAARSSAWSWCSSSSPPSSTSGASSCCAPGAARRHDHRDAERSTVLTAGAPAPPTPSAPRRALVRAVGPPFAACGAGSWDGSPSGCASWRWRSPWRRWWPWSPTRPVAGVHALSVAFLTHVPTPPGIPGGGISNAIVGSVIIVGRGRRHGRARGHMAAPLPGRAPRAPRRRRAVRGRRARRRAVHRPGHLRLAVLVGPFARTTRGWRGASRWPSLMLPIVIRASEAAMRSVPRDLWEAGLALGVRRSPGGAVGRPARCAARARDREPAGGGPRHGRDRTLVVHRSSGPRSSSRTRCKPMGACRSRSTPTGPQAFPAAQLIAWGTAFVLLVLVLVLSIVARIVSARLNRQAR